MGEDVLAEQVLAVILLGFWVIGTFDEADWAVG